VFWGVCAGQTRFPLRPLHDLHRIWSGPLAPPCDAGVMWSAVSPPSVGVSVCGGLPYPGQCSPCSALCLFTAVLRLVRSVCVRVVLVGVVAL
jgi:hypothetical protein